MCIYPELKKKSKRDSKRAGEMAQALRTLAEILEGSSSILSRISTHWILFAILFFLLPTLGASWHLYLH